jgi:hypothetical protein
VVRAGAAAGGRVILPHHSASDASSTESLKEDIVIVECGEHEDDADDDK